MNKAKLLLCMAPLMTLLSGCARITIVLTGEVVTKELEFSDSIDQISINNIHVKDGLKNIPVNVNFHAGEEKKITLTAPSDFTKYLRTQTFGTSAFISGNMNERYAAKEITIDAYGYVFSSAHFSYSKVACEEGVFNDTKTQLYLSGASSITMNRMNFGTLDLNFSGASYARMDRINATTINYSLSGASHIASELINSTNESINLSGASILETSGVCDVQAMNISGASKYHAVDKTVKNINISLSGASEGKVKCTKILTGSVSGASTLVYYGNPEQVRVSNSGVSTITKAE